MGAASPLPVVLLPGLNGTSGLLEDVRARLAATRPAFIIDYPPDRKLGYSDLVPLVRQRLPNGRFVILGESFSGPIAIEVAAAMPDRVAGLILAASFARSPLRAIGPLARGWLAMRMPRPLWAMAAGLMGRHSTPEMKQKLAAALSLVSPEVVAFRFGEATRVDKRSRLKWVACPVLYIHGKRDWMLGRGPMQDVASAARNFKSVEIDAPHMLLATHAPKAADAIERFCAKL